LLVIGLFVRLSMLLWYLSTHGWVPETWEYEVIAFNLLEKQEFFYPYLGNNYRSYVGPVFPFLCYVLHLVGGKSLILYIVFHLSVALTTIWLTYRLAFRWFSREAGILAGLFAALEPGLVVYNSYKVDVLTLAICLLLVGLALFERVAATGRYRLSALLGGFVGLAMLTRLDLVAILAPFALWLVLAGAPRRAVLLHGLLAAGMALLLTVPWLARNYAVHGRLLLTTTSGQQLWIGIHEGTTGPSNPLRSSFTWDSASPSIRDAVAHGTELEQYDAFRTEAVRAILIDPTGFLRRAAGKFVYFWWFTPTYGMFYKDIPVVLRDAYKVLYAVLLALAVVGVVTVWKDGDARRWLPAWSALAVIITIVLIHSIYFVEGRHRVLVMPLFLMFSAYGAQTVAALAARWRLRRSLWDLS
jgi:4-amino-4-deoxy-L-arabinose transferase-like glycosyltransferase